MAPGAEPFPGAYVHNTHCTVPCRNAAHSAGASQLHGGTIAAHSPGRGAGSSFRLLFPLVPVGSDGFEPNGLGQHAERSGETVDAGESTGERLEGLTILVVDDELDARLRLLLQRLLEERGAHVILAASAAEALASFGRSAPDILVSDIGMPGRDGFALRFHPVVTT